MTKELDSTQDAELRELYRRCNVSNNGTDNPIGEDEFISVIKDRMIMHADMVIGSDKYPYHNVNMKDTDELANMKLRTEQRERNKA